MSVAVDEQTFVANKPCSLDDKLKSKIDGLLDAYTCFSPDHNTSFFKHHSHDEHRHHQRCHHHRGKKTAAFHHHARLPCPSFIIKSGTAIERLVTAYLNKITNQNFEKVSGVLTELVSKGKVDVKTITHIVLQKCEKHSCYIDIFVKLLCNIHNACDAEKQLLVHKVLLMYMQDFLTAQDFLKFKFHNESYSTFCDNVTSKTTMIGKHKTILALTRHLLNDKKDSYFESVFKEMRTGMGGNEDVCELLLDFVIEFIKVDRGFHIQVKDFFDIYNMGRLTNKARFKVMDIYAYKAF